LKPIKAKDLIVSTALETNLPVEIVGEIIKVYWKDVRSSLSELKAPRVHVTNLGDFVTKHWAIAAEVEKLTRFLESIKDNPKKQHIIPRVEERLSLLSSVESIRLEEEQRKEFIKIHKKSLANVKPNIQKQETDLRGYKK
jgi:hypothetical protein